MNLIFVLTHVHSRCSHRTHQPLSPHPTPPHPQQVFLNVTLKSRSVYRMVLRYINPNEEPLIGEITVLPAGAAAGAAAGAGAGEGEGVGAAAGDGAGDAGPGAAGAGDGYKGSTTAHEVGVPSVRDVNVRWT